MTYRIIILFLTFMVLLPVSIPAAYRDLSHYNYASDSSLSNCTPEDNWEINSMVFQPDSKGKIMDNSYDVANIGSLVSKHNKLKIADVLEFLNSGVEKGELTGAGKTPFTIEGKLRAFRNLLTTSESLIEIGDITGACQQLNDAYKKSNGKTTVGDYVTGPAAPKLNQMINNLMNDLGCKNKLA